MDYWVPLRRKTSYSDFKMKNGNSVFALHALVKGRARFRVEGLKKNPILKQILETEFQSNGLIETLVASDLTGTVLVFYAATTPLHAIERSIASEIGRAHV